MSHWKLHYSAISFSRSGSSNWNYHWYFLLEAAQGELETALVVFQSRTTIRGIRNSTGLELPL